MKKNFLLFFLITSCFNKTDKIIDTADSFIKNSADDFLKNQGLMNYRYYNPRTQFYYGDSDNDTYRIMISEESIKFHCFSDSCLLDIKIGLKNSKYLKKGFYKIKNDTIRLHFKKDSIVDLKVRFDKQPLEIFKNYVSDLKKLGISSYYISPSKNAIEVPFSSQHRLIKSDNIKEYISNQDRIIKTYKNNWSLIERDKD